MILHDSLALRGKWAAMPLLSPPVFSLMNSGASAEAPCHFREALSTYHHLVFMHVHTPVQCQQTGLPSERVSR